MTRRGCGSVGGDDERLRRDAVVMMLRDYIKGGTEGLRWSC